MSRILKVIDTISEYSGRITQWVCVILVLVLTYEVVMRYAFNAPTTWAHLTSIMMLGTIVVMGLAYTHLHHGHIRVDVFFNKLSPRGKAIANVVFYLLLFFPLLAVLIKTSSQWMVYSWVVQERRIESYWYPLAYPFRIVVLIGWSLFALQCLAHFIRDLYFAIRGKTID